MARNKPSPAQIRDRKAKRLAIGLGVVLLAIVGIEGPTFLKLVNGSSSSSASAVTAPISAATSVAAAANADQASQGLTVASATVGGVAVTAAAGPSGHLKGLAGFAIKDPFHAQEGVAPAAGAASATTTSAATTTASKTSTKAETTTATTTPTTPATSLPASTTTTTAAPPVTFTTAPAGPPNAAVILTNGKREIVPVGGSFPTVGPLFKLVSLGAKKQTIRITVLGGSFSNGSPALMLAHGKTLTLANESDGGSRYVVKLVKLTIAQATASTSTTPAIATTPVLGATTTK